MWPPSALPSEKVREQSLHACPSMEGNLRERKEGVLEDWSAKKACRRRGWKLKVGDKQTTHTREKEIERER